MALDPGRHPPLEGVERHGALLLMHVSRLGEVEALARAVEASPCGAIDLSP